MIGGGWVRFSPGDDRVERSVGFVLSEPSAGGWVRLADSRGGRIGSGLGFVWPTSGPEPGASYRIRIGVASPAVAGGGIRA